MPDNQASEVTKAVDGVLKHLADSRVASRKARERRLAEENRKRAIAERRDRIDTVLLRARIALLKHRLGTHEDHADSASLKRFLRVARLLDLVLEPSASEEVVGDLFEQYLRRLHAPGDHSQWWLYIQAVWIILNRGIDLLGRVRKAWAGR